MADLAEVYSATRARLADFVAGLPAEDLERPVPATPGWTIRAVVAHLAGVVERIAEGDFPREFFLDLGSERGVALLNEWTGRQIAERHDRPLQDVLDEWEKAAAAILPMLRGETPLPEGVLPFAGHVLVTDVGIHQQDVYGALGIARDRDAAPVRIGFATYVAGAGLRLEASGRPALRLVTEHKEVVAGNGEPAATVRGPRYELFRALSGRRSPDQIRAYEWEGDPESFLDLFYPYGVRAEPLVE